MAARWVLLVLVVASSAAAAPTTLYFHLDGLQDFPINTQPPDDRFQHSEAVGLATHTTSCVPSTGDGPAEVSQSWHTWYGYSTPGYVEYDFEEDGGPRYHTERGLAGDVMIDPAEEMVLTWILESQWVSGEPDPDPNGVPAPMPQVTVEATMRTGDDVKVGRTAYDEGQVIARGQAPPVLLAPGQPGHLESEGRHIYVVAVPMRSEMDRIPRDEAFNLRIDVRVEVPGCDGDQAIMPNTVRTHTSPAFRPHMTLGVLNPIEILSVTPRFVGDDVIAKVVAQSPWGNYDVDESEGGVQVVVSGPVDATLVPVEFIQHFHVHGRHQEPVELTYEWPRGGAPLGEYTLAASVRNDQRTAVATAEARFEIGPDLAYDHLGKEIPSEPEATNDASTVGWALGVVVSLAAAASRRKSA